MFLPYHVSSALDVTANPQTNNNNFERVWLKRSLIDVIINISIVIITSVIIVIIVNIVNVIIVIINIISSIIINIIFTRT